MAGSANSKKAGHVVRKLVAHHFGSKAAKIKREAGGLTNLVFAVEHAAGNFIVRVNFDRAKLNPFLKEQWAVERAREAGVPAPQILEVGDMPVPHMILKREAGEPATHHPDRKRILRDLGSHAARINLIQTSGFGGTFDWSRNQLSRNSDWSDFLHGEFRLNERLRTLTRHRMLPSDQVKKIRATLDSACQPGRKPALNHGDLRLKNVLVDSNGKITTILDWEHCSSNLAPEWEFSLALHDLSIDEKQEFLTGYGLSTRAFAAMAPTIKALNVTNYVEEVERLAKKNDTVQLALYRLRLTGALDLYSL
jgi:hygromycin-B 4-O-kinase